MHKVLIAAAAASLLAGCGGLEAAFDPDGPYFEKLNEVVETGQELEGDAYAKLGQGVDLWCATVPELVRLRVREGINAAATEGRVEIDCRAAE